MINKEQKIKHSHEIAKQTTQPKVAIIILNWNGWKDTINCLEHVLLLSYPNYRIIVVDNGSEDDSWEQLQDWKNQRNDRVVFIRNSENLGFTGGCNVGISYALARQADYIFLLNNDAKVKADTLNALVNAALQSDAAIVGVRVLNEDGNRVLFSGRSWPAHLFGFGGHMKSDSAKPFWPSSDADGCAVLIHRNLLDQRFAEFGYFLDPKLFMYWEETDLCLYGRSRGHQCVVARDAVVHHELAKTSGGSGNPRSYYYLTRNRIFMANRWLNLPWKIFFHFYYIPSRLIIQFINLCRMHVNAVKVAKAVTHGLIDGYRGRTGKWTRHGGWHV